MSEQKNKPTDEAMTKQALDPYDVDLMNQTIAMYGSCGTLMGKLKALWQTSEKMILAAEDKHAKAIKKAWGSLATEAMESEGILSRVGYAQSLSQTKDLRQGGFLLVAYFGALLTVGKIQKAFASALEGKTPSEFPADLFSAELLGNRYYLDQCVPLFFELQLHCFYLVRDANTAKGFVVDKITSHQRAVKGGKGKAEQEFGEVYLKEDVLNYLTSQEENSFKSVEDLASYRSKGLNEVLVKYQEGIGSPRNHGEPALTYAENFTLDSLLSKLKQWAKEDVEIRSQLERVCQRGKK